MFRRSPPRDPALHAVLEQIDRAKDLLLAAVPSPRGKVSVPLAEAVFGFEQALAVAKGSLGSWDGPLRPACETALSEALAAAERLRLAAPPLDYEAMVYALDDLLAPLEAFAEAHRDLRGRR